MSFSDEQLDWTEDVVEETTTHVPGDTVDIAVENKNSRTINTKNQKKIRTKPKKGHREKNHGSPMDGEIWQEPASTLIDLDKMRELSKDNSSVIRALLNRASRWNYFASTRGITLPNEDHELWAVLKKLLQDAYDQTGEMVCAFEIRIQLSRSKVLLMSHVLRAPEESEKSCWFNPSNFKEPSQQVRPY